MTHDATTNRTDTMENATPRNPHDIVNRGTSYEVAITHVDGRHIIVGFTTRTTKRGLIEMVQARGEELLAVMGDDMKDDVEYPFVRDDAGRWTWAIDEWTIGFTGRTEREVYWELNR